MPEGGLVPKSLYRTAEEMESEENHLLTDSIYKSASIFKAAPFEVPVLVVLILLKAAVLYSGLHCHQLEETHTAGPLLTRRD